MDVEVREAEGRLSVREGGGASALARAPAVRQRERLSIARCRVPWYLKSRRMCAPAGWLVYHLLMQVHVESVISWG